VKLASFRVLVGGVLLCSSLVLFSQAPAPKDRAWQILQSSFSESRPARRAEAVRALSLLPNNSAALQMVRKALADSDPEVRSAAATAMEDLRCRSCIPDLKKALNDKDPSFVLAAAHALRSLGDPSAYEVYFAVLTGERKTGRGLIAGQEEMLKDRKKMAEFGFEQGIGFVPYGSIGWSLIKTIATDDAAPVRASAASVLASDPDPQSANALVKAISDKNWVVRAAAIASLAKRGDANQLNQIVPAMTDSHEVVRMTAAAAVIRLSR
jgi:HEAT repeat protein